MNARHLLAASFATLALPLAAQDGSPQRLLEYRKKNS